MERLLKVWFIDVRQEHPLIGIFRDWFDQQVGCNHTFCSNFYGVNEKGIYDCSGSHCENVIALEEWYKCVFSVKEQFEKGEEVLVKDKHHNSWVEKTFVCEYKERFVVENKGYLTTWDECKKKPSELDVKIEELKKLAEEKSVKLTIICEDV